MRVMRTFALVAVLVTIASPGCIFSPEKKPPKPEQPKEYQPPISPQAVLGNMILAYTSRDSAQTDSVYDDAYQGTSTDPSGIVGNFTLNKAAEIRHVGALKLSQNIVSVLLDLGHAGQWQVLPPDAADPPDWAVIQINNSLIRVDDVNQSTFESTNQTYTYKFIPTPVSSTETRWKIIRWEEVVTNPPPP